MRFITNWVKAYRSLKKAGRPLDFAKIFNIPEGQVIVQMSYPQIPQEPYELIQTTMVRGKVIAKITTPYLTEDLMKHGFEDFTQDKAIKFNEQIQSIL